MSEFLVLLASNWKSIETNSYIIFFYRKLHNNCYLNIVIFMSTLCSEKHNV